MFLSLYSKQDLYNFYGYGCYCLNLGDRPMSGSTFGRPPVDEKDRHCYDLQQCNKCAKIEHGSQCLSELTNYQVTMQKSLLREKSLLKWIIICVYRSKSNFSNQYLAQKKSLIFMNFSVRSFKRSNHV